MPTLLLIVLLVAVLFTATLGPGPLRPFAWIALGAVLVLLVLNLISLVPGRR